MKKYFIHIFVAILILSSSFPTSSVSALSTPSIIEPEPLILRDEQVRLDPELAKEVPLRLQNRTEPIEQRVQVAPNAGQIAQTQAQVQSIFDCNTVTDVPPVECEALVALYNSTNGAFWTSNDAWLTGLEVGNWEGVDVAAGHVLRIVLPSNNLSGIIPPELGTLTKLGYLDLKENQLSGNIPPELGNMKNLLYLRLEINGLTGSIPAELGGMSSLQTLGLAINQLTGGIPIELDKLANLAYLSLQGNELTGSIPLSFVNLTYLEQFYFSGTHLCEPWGDNDFQTWKKTVTTWRSTGFVCTSYCTDVTEILVIECEALVALYNSTSGQDWLDTSAPWFTTTTVSSWYGVNVLESKVTELNLYGNRLSGSIPPELGNLAYLQTLDLAGNQLSGSIPAELGKLDNLTTLGLGANQLSGSLPAELGDLFALQSFDLGVNELTGSIPSSFVDLDLLEFFAFPETHLCEPADGTFLTWKGTVTSWLGTGYTCISTSYCESLTDDISYVECEALVALYNSTSGPEWEEGYGTAWFTTMDVISWIGVDITDRNVTELNLTGIQLKGNIPPELDKLTHLINLYLGDNQLTGIIPPELGTLTTLQTLDLAYNQLTGSIPPELGNLTSLENLNLNSNDLSGSIPAELGSLSNLIVLKLYSNQLTGSISPAVGNLTNLQTLDLGDNQLTGIIPPEVGMLSSLEDLVLGLNDLSGNIPAEMGNLNMLLYLYLGDNQLTGSIPPEVGNLLALQDFDLAYNQLTGSIPAELGKLGQLTTLWLGANQLSGSIPAELGNLANLQSFGLAYNQLTGSIPLSFVNLTYLEVFHFIDTHLCEPANETFQAKMNNPLLYWEGTDLICHAPVAMADAYSTAEDSELVVTAMKGVLINDTDADWDTLTAELVSTVADGSLVLAADGSFTYKPHLDFNGEDSFKYKVFDSVEYSGVITVTIVVNQALFSLYYFPLIIK